MKRFFWKAVLLVALCCLSVNATGKVKASEILVSLPGFEKKIGIKFNPEKVDMVAIYRGNSLYLRPFSKKLKLLLGVKKAVATKTLSLPKMVAEEAMRGRQESSTLLVSDRPFIKPVDTFLIDLEDKVVSGRFAKNRGDGKKIGVILFLKKKGVHLYQFIIKEDGDDVVASFHTFTEQQYKSAKKSVEKKLKAAGQRSAARKVDKL